MKTSHFAFILVLAAASAFACNDDGDRIEGGAGSAGKTNAAGSAGKTNAAGADSVAGAGGGDTGAGGADAGAGGSAGSGNDGGMGGAAGSSEGGAAGAAGTGVVGGAGGDGGAGGNGGAEGGEGGEGGEGNVAALEIIGSWIDNFTGPMTITATDFGGSPIISYDNDANAVYTQWPASNQWTPNKFAKTLYAEVQNNSFYYCMVVFSADTLEAALADTTVPDLSDPDHTGCGGTFPWSKATRQ